MRDRLQHFYNIDTHSMHDSDSIEDKLINIQQMLKGIIEDEVATLEEEEQKRLRKPIPPSPYDLSGTADQRKRS